MKSSAIIGILHISEYNSSLVTVEELKDEIKYGVYDAKKYCDFRYSTNLVRFFYDPFTGEKINWKEVKKQLN